MKNLWRILMRGLDVLFAPLTLLSTAWLRAIREAGLKRMPVSKRIFLGVGIYPLRDHFYEPQFHPRHLRAPLDADRALPGIDWNVAAQLEQLRRFRWQEELAAIPESPQPGAHFHYGNRAFGPGDAEYYYSVIRCFRPRRIVEIGAGNSTALAALAIARNRAETPGQACELVCIEPHPRAVLRSIDAKVLEQGLEDVDPALFASLEANDVLFIDSSHMIRPQGDVLREYLTILPTLRPGVLVHVHDIFSPRDYPAQWLIQKNCFWNEQYLLEAFLSHNRDFEVLGALNYLYHHHREALYAACPVLRRHPGQEPGSFWLIRTSPSP